MPWIASRSFAPGQTGIYGLNFANESAAHDWAVRDPNAVAYRICLCIQRGEQDWSPAIYVGWRLSLTDLERLGGPRAQPILAHLRDQGASSVILAQTGQLFLDQPDPLAKNQPVRIAAPAPWHGRDPASVLASGPLGLYRRPGETPQDWRLQSLVGPAQTDRPLPAPRRAPSLRP